MINKMILKDFHDFAIKIFEKIECPSQTLLDSMKYSFFSGGKRIRAQFVYVIGDIFDISYEDCHKIAFSIEAIHTYSLIHDDLPSMDNDNIRRGKATCHIKFGESTAILTGDALQSLAFDVIQTINTKNINILKKIISTLTKYSGASGMVAGQQLDIEGEDKKLNLKELETIHINKTGKMFKASILIPYSLSETYDFSLALQLDKISNLIGLSFQIKDDILDVTQNTIQLGKTSSKDIRSNKSTYVSLMGLEQTIKYLDIKKIEIKHNIRKIVQYNHKYSHFEKLIDLVIDRNH